MNIKRSEKSFGNVENLEKLFTLVLLMELLLTTTPPLSLIEEND